MNRKKRQVDVAVEPVMRSSPMRQVAHVLRAIAAKDVTLTLIGESGTGKEVLARHAHGLSARRRGPFVPVNCAAIPESLFESELFGHERGAFTGANVRARGKVEAAEGGTLFLDEIGELSSPLQAKLLRFVETRRFMRVGSATKLHADVRLMLATSRPLDEEMRAGRFRADLFYRIHGMTIRVPALRDRRADIAPLLREAIVELSARHHVRPPRLGRQVKMLLLGYDWPGNVRELRNVAEALCLLRGGRDVRVADLPLSVRAQVAVQSIALEPALRLLEVDLNSGLEVVTRRIVEAVLQLEGGNKAKAAARLQVSPRTMQRYVASGRARMPVIAER